MVCSSRKGKNHFFSFSLRITETVTKVRELQMFPDIPRISTSLDTRYLRNGNTESPPALALLASKWPSSKYNQQTASWSLSLYLCVFELHLVKLTPKETEQTWVKPPCVIINYILFYSEYVKKINLIYFDIEKFLTF